MKFFVFILSIFIFILDSQGYPMNNSTHKANCELKHRQLKHRYYAYEVLPYEFGYLKCVLDESYGEGFTVGVFLILLFSTLFTFCTIVKFIVKILFCNFMCCKKARTMAVI